MIYFSHDDVIKWKHFPRYWPFVRRIHRSPVNSQHKGQWRGALMFSLICAPINGWVNNRECRDLRCCRAHYDVNVMCFISADLIVFIWYIDPYWSVMLHWHRQSCSRSKVYNWQTDKANIQRYRWNTYLSCSGILLTMSMQTNIKISLHITHIASNSTQSTHDKCACRLS